MSFVVESLNIFFLCLELYEKQSFKEKISKWYLTFDGNISGGDNIELIHRDLNFQWQKLSVKP